MAENMSVQHRVTKPHILLVDDEIMILTSLGAILEEKGYQLSTASSFQEVKRVCGASDSPICCAVLDMMLPQGVGDLKHVLGGVEIAMWLRKKYPAVKLIGFSASSPDSWPLSDFMHLFTTY